MTEETMMGLRNDVNDVCPRVIPDLCRNLHRKIHNTAAVLTTAVQTIDTTVRKVLVCLPSGPAPPAHGVRDAMTEWPAARSDDQSPVPSDTTMGSVRDAMAERWAARSNEQPPTPPA
jgi:hypothetical protein